MRQVRLPDKLSDLLELAVADCLEVEAEGKHEFDMTVYYERLNGHCAVCMAGAVMLRRLPHNETADMLSTRQWGAETQRKLYAIDDMRTGGFENAAERLGLSQLGVLEAAKRLIDEAYTDFDDNWSKRGRAPWPIYLEAADMLRQAGL
jgi:hypothetical protein